jgi:replication-associated recombination protein RarA
MVTFGQLKTVNGYQMDEVASAFQKCVRRNLEADAIYRGVELDKSGYGNYCAKRTLIIASEDIGIAAPPGFFADLWAIYQAWERLNKAKDHSAPIHLIHMIQKVCRVEKCRLADTALTYYYGDNVERLEIPDFALGMHTGRGRRMGRGTKDFYDVGAVIEPAADIEDPYLELALKADGYYDQVPRTLPLFEDGAF